MGQSFFTLSVGIGALAIFGSYIGKERRLTGEAISITVLDTIVALVAGLIIFPSCFAFDVNPGQGPGLVFVTLPNVFREMAGRKNLGSSVLPVHVVCSIFHDHRSVPEYYPIRKRYVGDFFEEICSY